LAIAESLLLLIRFLEIGCEAATGCFHKGIKESGKAGAVLLLSLPWANCFLEVRYHLSIKYNMKKGGLFGSPLKNFEV